MGAIAMSCYTAPVSFVDKFALPRTSASTRPQRVAFRRHRHGNHDGCEANLEISAVPRSRL